MAETYVESLTIYPLGGARGNPCDTATLGDGGFEGDHEFVLYEPSAQGSGYTRVGQKQCRSLAQLTVYPYTDGSVYVERDAGLVGGEFWAATIPALARAALVEVMEFGDQTPCFDMGDDAAASFAEYTGRGGVRVGRRTPDWHAGRDGRVADRTVAAVHIGLAETVEELANKLRAGGEETSFGYDRLRAQIVVRGGEPFSEAGWVGRKLRIGAATLMVDRLTKRCPVPGNDQCTGASVGDITGAYKDYTIKALDNGAPTIGVYAHSVTGCPVVIHHDDEVELVA